MKIFTNKYVFLIIVLFSSVDAFSMACKDIMSGKLSKNFSENVKSDNSYSLDLAKTTSVLKKTKRLNSPVVVTNKMQKFREDYLPIMQMGSSMTEAFVRYMEADLRIKSNGLAASLVNQKNIESYDLVIVGAGVHGVIGLQAALKRNGNYKILVIESSDTAAANFRYATDVFNINSSNRASGKDRLPLPGEGNINELPRLPIQVSDISAVKYPTAGDLGATLVAGLYSAATKYPNVDVLFNSNVQVLKNTKSGVAAEIKTPYGDINVKGSRVSIATGLGTPSLPRGVVAGIRKNKELVKSTNIEKTLPRVMTFEDFVRLLSKSEDPKQFIKNKTVSVVGTGDSANVAIEFMLGYAAKNAYGLSSAQTLGPKKIFWLGQSARSCEQFIADIRSRYAQIGTGFRSSSPDVAAIIEPIPNRISSVEPAGKNKVNAILDESFLGDTKIKSDFIVLATGFKGGVPKLISGLLKKSAQKDIKLSTEDFYLKYTDFVTGKTKTSEGENTRVARSVNIGGKSSAKSPKVIINGPAAGKLPQESELAGIIQNSVSIFNNAPRTESSIGKLLKGLKPRSKNTKMRAQEIELIEKSDKSLTVFEIVNLADVRTISGLNELYLKSVLANVLSEVRVNKSTDVKEIELNFYNGKDSVVVKSNLGNVNIKEVIIDPLVATRDFFNTMKQILTYVSKSAVVKVPVTKGEVEIEHLTIEYGNSNRPSDTLRSKEVKNNSLQLRGF